MPHTLHPRHFKCETARGELAIYVGEWWNRHDLTTAEVAEILSGLARDRINNLLRDEREAEDEPKDQPQSEE